MSFRCLAVATFILASMLSRTTLADLITFTNGGQSILINDRNVADPYPSTIDASGLTGTITNIQLTMFGVSHTFSDDMGAAILSPVGTPVLLFSGPGPDASLPGNKRITNLTWTFDDNALEMLPADTTPVSGTFKPGLDQWDETFPDPNRPGQFLPESTTFNKTFQSLLGENLNGQWQLLMRDANSGDSGIVAGGWSIAFEVTAVPEPSTYSFMLLSISWLAMHRPSSRIWSDSVIVDSREAKISKPIHVSRMTNPPTLASAAIRVPALWPGRRRAHKHRANAKIIDTNPPRETQTTMLVMMNTIAAINHIARTSCVKTLNQSRFLSAKRSSSSPIVKPKARLAKNG